MLCPEVWNFGAPESGFRTEKGELSQNSCVENIKKLYYNHLVSVVLPDTLRTPESLTNVLSTDCEYYKIADFSLVELVNKDFINSFIKRGSLTALSINRRIDCDDCVSVTPDGLIVLSLTKESYQTLGLDGVVSRFCQNTKGRYIVHVNLLKECFKPGKKNYERAKICLSRLSNCTLLVSWEPVTEDVCPSSVAKYFHDLNYDVKVCTPNFKVRTDYAVKVPDFELQDAHEFAEWLGAYSLQTDLQTGGPDSYFTTYETPEPYVEYGQVKFLQWKGFFSPKQIERLFEELMSYARSEGKPWVSLYVQGFTDAPVSWGMREHHFYTSGDSCYAIALNSNNYLLCRQICSNKKYK